MFRFKRGLSDDFVEALGREYEKQSLWYEIINDPDLFVGIRDNYLNVYYLGNSLLKLNFEGGIIRSYTHYKYLLKSKLKNPYVGFGFDRAIDYSGYDVFMEASPSIETLKRASKPYAGLEKKGVHQIVKDNINVIDVEIALTQDAEDREKDDIGNPEKEDRSAPRIDFAALREVNGGELQLQFFEAKDFSNSALRDRKVLKQIKSYEVLIDKFRDQIIDSYERVCRNTVQILPEHRVCPRAKMVATGTKFSVSNQPRLVIFGFDQDQKTGKNWVPHFEKLKDLLPGRVLAKGKSSDFRTGIK